MRGQDVADLHQGGLDDLRRERSFFEADDAPDEGLARRLGEEDAHERVQTTVELEHDGGGRDALVPAHRRFRAARGAAFDPTQQDRLDGVDRLPGELGVGLGRTHGAEVGQRDQSIDRVLARGIAHRPS